MRFQDYKKKALRSPLTRMWYVYYKVKRLLGLESN